MGEIVYNGVSSKDIGLEVESFPTYRTPKRSYSTVQIPGRNGDLIVDNGRWDNTVRTYSVSIGSYDRSYYEMMNKVANWLLSAMSYSRLEDSYEPDCYRLAVFLNEVEFSNLFNQGGKAVLDFNCKPQRFLKIGDEVITLTERSNVLQNPTNYASLPIIKIYGSGTGTLVVGTYTITINNIENGIVIDSEIQDAYLGNNNKNQSIVIPNGFPKIDPGRVSIGFSGGITKVEVTPKWFTL